MNALLKDWQRRSLIIALVTLAVCGAMTGLASTEWAEGLRHAVHGEGEHGGDGERPGGWVIFAVSIVKMAVLLGVPLLLTLAVRRLLAWHGARAASR